MNPFTWVYEFLSNRQIRLTHRVSVIIVIISSALLVDNYLGVSNHLTTNYRLEEINKIDQILSSPTSDSVSKKFALFERDRVMNRKTLLDYLLFRRSSWASWNLKNAKASNPIPIANWSESNIKESLLFYTTASGLIYFAGIAMFIFVLFSKLVDIQSFAVRVATSIIILCAFILVGSLFQKLLTLIPIIKSNTEYNFLINFAAQLIFIFGIIVPFFIFLGKKSNKSSDL